jgi:cytochrome c oxidase cbb3-type subunit 4
MEMSSGLLSGLFTVVLLLAFIGIVFWAWSARRREKFEAAARLPLEEDDQERP